MQTNEAIALDSLVAKPIEGLTNEEALKHIGLLIDGAADCGSTLGTARAFELLDQFRARTLSAVQGATAHYFSANAWQNKRLERGNAERWSWEQPQVQAQILELRKAVQVCTQQKLDASRAVLAIERPIQRGIETFDGARRSGARYHSPTP
jgi:hypothetical protein